MKGLKFPAPKMATKNQSLKLGNEPLQMKFRPTRKIKFAQPKLPVFRGVK